MSEGLSSKVSQALSAPVRPFLKGRRSEVADNIARAPLAIWPSDPWPSQSNYGQWLLSGLAQYPAGFEAGVDAFWSVAACAERHNFSWLYDLKAMGGEQARKSARVLVASWVERYGAYKKRPKTSRAFADNKVIAKRCMALLRTYDFHGASATDSYQSLVSLILNQDASFIYKRLSGGLVNVTGGRDYLLEAAALLNIALCLSADPDMTRDPKVMTWIEVATKSFIEALDVQILEDGGHITRNPEKLVEISRHCLDIRRLFSAVNMACPSEIQHGIDRMAQALKFFRYTDKNLAVFHGGQESYDKILDLILHQVGQNKKIVKSLPNSKYERLTQGRTTIMMDVGNAPPTPFDRHAHFAPLAFELSHGRDRIVVNCGTHTNNDLWRDALRRTSAHSTLTLGNRDVMSAREDGSIRAKPSQVLSERSEHKGAILLEAMHDGYSFGEGAKKQAKHIRRLYVSDKGQDIRGEDSLYSSAACEEDMEVAIRFHLHPRVRVSLVRNGDMALLRLFSGVGWRFQCSGAQIHIEDSIYMGDGMQASVPIKTKQLVLKFSVLSGSCGDQVKWAFQRDA